MLQDLLARVVGMQELDIHPKALILHEVRCAMSQPHDRDRGARDHFHGAHSYICHTTSETMKIEKLTKEWKVEFYRILTRWNSFDKVDMNTTYNKIT